MNSIPHHRKQPSRKNGTKFLSFLLVLLIASFLLTGCNPSSSVNDSEEDTIRIVNVPTEEMVRKRNKVRTCVVKTDTDNSCEHSTFNENGFLMEYQWYKSCGSNPPATRELYQYDGNGKITEKQVYEDGIFSRKTVYAYSDTLLQTERSYDVAENRLFHTQKYFYTPKGKLDYQTDDRFRISYSYDSNGLVISTLFMDLNQKEGSEQKEYFWYNKNGWKMKSESMNNGEFGGENTFYEYSEEGRLIKQYRVYKHYGTKYTCTYEYNQGGLLTKMIQEKKASGLAIQEGHKDETYVTTYEYTYF